MADGSLSSYGAVPSNITTTAKQIVAARGSRDGGVFVQNTHASNILYLGADSDVSATVFGARLAAGESVTIPTRGDVWGFGSAAATTVNFWELY